MVGVRPRAHQRGVQIEPRLLTHFSVEGEPVPKARPRVVNRHAFTPKSTRDFEHLVQQYCFVANPRLRPAEGNIRLVLRFHLKALGRGDLDNYVKGISDALNGIAWFDDAQVTELDAKLIPFSSEQPHSSVEVWLVAVPITT